jgi:hypothetical protein
MHIFNAMCGSLRLAMNCIKLIVVHGEGGEFGPKKKNRTLNSELKSHTKIF